MLQRRFEWVSIHYIVRLAVRQNDLENRINTTVSGFLELHLFTHFDDDDDHIYCSVADHWFDLVPDDIKFEVEGRFYELLREPNDGNRARAGDDDGDRNEAWRLD